MFPLTTAVRHLLIINVILFFATLTLFPEQRIWLALQSPAGDYFRPWQIITHMFMHGTVNHLVFNMLSLYFIGPMLENHFGTKKFFLFYIFCGLGGAFLQILFKDNPMWGASGAITGLFVGLAYIYPNMDMNIMFIPIPIKAKYLAIVYIGVDFFLGVGSFNTGIAHFGHLGGALFALIYLMYLRKYF